MIIKHTTSKNPLLSILICHLPEREKQFNNLLISLINNDSIEVISENSPRGIISTGIKRNKLLNEASGEYSAFVDDDDSVSEDYTELIINAIKTKPDCVGMCGLLYRPDTPIWQFRHSITVNRWCKDKKRHIYFRTPNHLNPIKTEICRKVMFKDLTIGEDKDYSDRIKQYLKTEVFIEKPIYFYRK